MRKATHYKVSGVLPTKPIDLPEGLDVEEVEVKLPAMSIDITPIHGGDSTTLTEYSLEEGTGFRMPGKGIFSEAEARKIRDFLNTILGKIRVLKDADGDVWFELEPDKFTLGGRAYDDLALEKARRKLINQDGLRNKSFEYVNNSTWYGPAEFIENTWE